MTASSRGVRALGMVQASRIVIGIFTSIFASRWLGPEAFGLVGFARSVAFTWWFLTCFGVYDLVTRQLAFDPTAGRVTLASARRLLWPMAVLSLLCMTGMALWLDPRPVMVGLVWLAGLTSVATSRWMLHEAALLGLGQASLQIVWALLSRVLQAILLVALLLAGFGAAGVLLAALVADSVQTLGVRRWLTQDKDALPSVSTAQIFDTVSNASPYALNLLASAIYLQSDILVIQAFRGEREVGLYQGAAILILQLPIIAQVINRASLPQISRVANDPAAVAAHLELPIRVLLAASIPMMAGGLMIAGPLMLWLLGPAYQESALLLQIMLPLLPLRFLNNASGITLTAMGKQRRRTQIIGGAAIFNLVGSLLLVPHYGAMGAAVATLVTELGIFLALTLDLRVRGVRLRINLPLIRTFAACLPMVVGLWYLADFHVVICILGGAAIWLGVGLPIRAWSPGDVRKMWQA